MKIPCVIVLCWLSLAGESWAVNVKSLCTRGGNDREALVKAIASLPAGQGDLYVPSGTICQIDGLPILLDRALTIHGDGITSVIQGTADPLFVTDEDSAHVVDWHDLMFIAQQDNGILRARKTSFAAWAPIMLHRVWFVAAGCAGTLFSSSSGGAEITHARFAGNSFCAENRVVGIATEQRDPDVTLGYIIGYSRFLALDAAASAQGENFYAHAGIEFSHNAVTFCRVAVDATNLNLLTISNNSVDQVPQPFVLRNVAPLMMTNNYIGGTGTAGEPLLIGDARSGFWMLTGNTLVRYSGPVAPAVLLPGAGPFTESANFTGGAVSDLLRR